MPAKGDGDYSPSHLEGTTLAIPDMFKSRVLKCDIFLTWSLPVILDSDHVHQNESRLFVVCVWGCHLAIMMFSSLYLY